MVRTNRCDERSGIDVQRKGFPGKCRKTGHGVKEKSEKFSGRSKKEWSKKIQRKMIDEDGGKQYLYKYATVSAHLFMGRTSLIRVSKLGQDTGQIVPV